MKVTIILRFAFLILGATVFCQQSNQEPITDSSRIGIDSTEGPEVQEAENSIMDSEFPETQPEGSGSEDIPLITGDQQEIQIKNGEKGGKFGAPKPVLWPDNLNNYFYYPYNNYFYYHYNNYRYYPYNYGYGYGYRRYCWWRYCRRFHLQCYRRPYYYCQRVCDYWGYYYY